MQRGNTLSSVNDKPTLLDRVRKGGHHRQWYTTRLRVKLRADCHHRRTRNFLHAAYPGKTVRSRLFPLPFIVFFSIPGTDTRTLVHTYICACERSASGICNAKLAGTKVINYALRATAVRNNRVAEARTPACTIIGPSRFSSLYIFSWRMILCVELLEGPLLQRRIWTMVFHRSLFHRRIKGNAEL